MKTDRPPLTFAQYSRIHSICASLLAHFGQDNGTRCLFFAICGAAILREHYGMAARAVCGSGGVVVHRHEGAPLITAWGVATPDGRAIATPDHFHCWVECDEWVIDFSAPTYGLGLELSSAAKDVALPPTPRKMFQKPVAQVGGRFDQLTRVGDAALWPDQSLTGELVGKAIAPPSVASLVRLACVWHQPVPDAMPASVAIMDDRGTVSEIPLIEPELAGAW
ncbi:DUF2026 family protein [Ralstonia pseudosolanacearum]|uniref:DUF2026 family protein n=1 Tax=Ralstonia pseudosolanacearum TaxID=1310165 RepID=UPI00201E46F9|nr:DUF2026 family protein [Ralstonia pseudosolanacearum]UQY83676.1 DUF2026 family protein [Ralstonia pseudosolanacearum]